MFAWTRIDSSSCVPGERNPGIAVPRENPAEDAHVVARGPAALHRTVRTASCFYSVRVWKDQMLPGIFILKMCLWNTASSLQWEMWKKVKSQFYFIFLTWWPFDTGVIALTHLINAFVFQKKLKEKWRILYRHAKSPNLSVTHGK